MPLPKLIAFDVDGTVFASPTKQFVTPRVVAAFEAAHDAGCTIAVASGRPFAMLGEQLSRAPWLDWAINCNGARLRPLRGGEPGHAFPIPRDVYFPLIDAIWDEGGTMTLLTSGGPFIERRRLARFDIVKDALRTGKIGARDLEEFQAEHAPGNPIDELVSTYNMEPIDYAPDLLVDNPGLELDKIDCDVPTAGAGDALMARMEKIGGLEIARLTQKDFEITSERASKGNAVSWLCRHLGIPESEAVAFGDSGNDLSMAGRGIAFVAMGNATDEVKAAADDQCDTVANDGVGRWIEERL